MKMKTIKFPDREQWVDLAERPTVNPLNLGKTVNEVFDAVRENGDRAVFNYTVQFDGVELDTLRVEEHEWEEAKTQLSDDLMQAMLLAKANIETFHLAQRETEKVIDTSNGVRCWRESRPIDRVGIYIPGGTAPLFSTVLMLGIPARIAGCKEIILCTPPDKKGDVHPAILFAARLVGITTVFKVGGIQAIAALTFGTESIPSVDKIFGPGNQYVTAAKHTIKPLICLPAPVNCW
jgi:histidinol dehydrogenase